VSPREIDLILAPDAATFVEPLPYTLYGLDPYPGIPMRSAQEWWKERDVLPMLRRNAQLSLSHKRE